MRRQLLVRSPIDRDGSRTDATPRMEGACYFLSSPAGKTCTHAKEFDIVIDQIVDNIEKHLPEDGYLGLYFTVVDPPGRFMNLRDMHELCEYFESLS